MLRLLADKRFAWFVVFLMPLIVAFLLQLLVYNVASLENAYHLYWYPLGAIIGLIIMCAPSYALLARLPVFTNKRICMVVFTVALVAIIPISSYLNKILLCVPYGRCA